MISDPCSVQTSVKAVILSERGPERFLQFGGGESKDLQLPFNKWDSLMPIRVKKVAENLYVVSAGAPEWRDNEQWSPKQPLDGKMLVNELVQRGFHVQDICDAMEEADPQWNKKLV